MMETSDIYRGFGSFLWIFLGHLQNSIERLCDIVFIDLS